MECAEKSKDFPVDERRNGLKKRSPCFHLVLVHQVLFSSTKSARLCAEKYHETTKMGNVMNVFVDVMGTNLFCILPSQKEKR